MTQQGQFLMSPPDQFLMSFDTRTWRALDWLAGEWPGKPLISVPDLYTSGPNPVRNKKTATKTIGILEDHGWLVRQEGPARVNGTMRRGVWRLPAHARQIMYAARGEIQRLAGRMLDDQYFTQQLLPDFMNEHPDMTADWDVVFDARGHFHEPHTGLVVPLGTIEVRRHLREVDKHTLPELQMHLPEMAIFPTCGPGHRYGAILFVEKEGFLPLFRAVRLAERYDLAIMSTKGLSVTAARLLVDQLCAAHEVPLLVLHDFDKSGFSILGTLRRDTRRYAFRNRIEVVDLGLRLEDVEDSGLETEEVVHRSDPAPNLRENGATAEEIAFLRTRRVELNAFASADFIAWIERKLEQHGVTKIVPDESALALAYRRSVASRHVASRLRSAIREAHRRAAKASVPEDLAMLVADGLRVDPTQSWDDVVRQLTMERAGKEER